MAADFIVREGNELTFYLLPLIKGHGWPQPTGREEEEIRSLIVSGVKWLDENGVQHTEELLDTIAYGSLKRVLGPPRRPSGRDRGAS